MNSESHVHAVARYYRRNTRAFLRMGENDGLPAIHIALWPEGTKTAAEALEVAHGLVLDCIRARSGQLSAVADLGCGMGAALSYLAAHLPSDVALLGLTMGTPSTERAGVEIDGRIQIQEGDFHCADTLLPKCTVAFTIEALAHSADIPAFFASVARLLEPGGSLIVMDDVAVDDQPPSAALQRYREHWLAPGVVPFPELQRAASVVGLTLQSDKDLTPWIRLGRPRDRWIRWTRPLWGWMCSFSEYAKSLSGGDARQVCLERGETQFRLLHFVAETKP